MTSSWTTTAPETAGFAGDIARKIEAGVEAGLLRSLHAVAVARDGQLVVEKYFAGMDEAIAEEPRFVRFGPDTMHDLRSVTKSIVSVLYGIALDRGLVPPPEAPLFAQFPEYPDLLDDPLRQQRTVRHALTMMLGMEWDESKPYTTTENSEVAMEFAADRYRFVLDRPLLGPPGEKWIYSGGAVALVGAIIERGTGKNLGEFAQQALFQPLGISQYGWFRGQDGVHAAASGLRLATRDLLRIGDMLVQGGVFEGRQIVPRDWLEASWTPAVEPWKGEDYGYLWYVGKAKAAGAERRTLSGYGNGGQRLFLMPELKLACVVYAGEYNNWDSWISPTRVWREIVLASLAG